MKYTQFQLYHFHFTGILPAAGTSVKTKIPHPTLPKTYFFLGTAGAVRIGPSLRQSVPLSEKTKLRYREAAEKALAERQPTQRGGNAVAREKPTLSLSMLKATL